MNEYYRIVGDEIHIAIKALPGASKTEFSASNDAGGEQEQRLRVRIAAAAEDGRANTELVAFLAKTFGCPKRDIHLLHGEKSRLKTIAVPLAHRESLEAIFRKENQQV
jgi:uncharacterized protein (TIGR00251 family)